MSPAGTVILLHGVGLDHTMWDRVTPTLAQQCTVHTPDLPGHGDAPDAPEGCTLTDLAAPLTGLGAGAVHLVGFSLGALVATRFALDHPERVASLTLISAVANRSAIERTSVTGRLEAARENLPATFDAAIERWFSPQWRATEPELAERVRAVLRANRPSSYLACYTVFAHADAELWPLLPRLNPRVLAMTGEQDPGSTPAMSAALAERVPHGRSAVVPGARHLLPLEHPEAVTEAVLAQLDDRPLELPTGAVQR
ncbi:alpha/beta fold hydrolase [Sciscionella marina]|uniref:alpha/beta fold hydrolase n=1 Tax=Sciscionella marina TaxID=508770 RepID=UPI0003719E83|nr:alpha/beta hydrolase [Sciscionella marina]